MPIRKTYGWTGPSLPGTHKGIFTPRMAPSKRPDMVDLEPAMPEIQDQLDFGACVFHSTSCAALFAEMMKMGQANYQFQPSRLFMYYNARKLMGLRYVNQDTGSDYATAMRACEKFGIADEKLWPYIPENYYKEPPPEVYANAKKEIVHEQFAVPQDVDHFEGCLADGFPLQIGVSIYESFELDKTAASGIIPMPEDQEILQGGHALIAVGYYRANPGRRLFKVRNSWGYDWGVRGYCWFPYEYLLDRNLSDDFRTVRAL